MSEKTEKATPYKLQKAKEKGQVSKSVELNTTILLVVMLAVGTALWPSLLQQIKSLMTKLLNLVIHLPFCVDNISKLQRLLLSTLTLLWLPLGLAAVLSLIVSTIAQTGFVWTMKPLTPDLKRFNLAQGFKRLFSSKLFFDALKNSLKLGLAFFLLALNLCQEISSLLQLMALRPQELPAVLMHFLGKLILELLFLLLALSILDKLYSRWKYRKDNRMSKQDVKDEYRQREGDPKIKAKIQQLQQQLRQKTAALAEVKTADLVLINPTHLAIALKYDRGLMPAPKVVCKAQGELAEQVRTLAKHHNISIIQNITLARALFATVELNQWIKHEHYPLAAMIFRELYQRQEETALC